VGGRTLAFSGGVKHFRQQWMYDITKSKKLNWKAQIFAVFYFFSIN